MTRAQILVDGNEAAAHVAYQTNEVIAIYPITPASAMGELADLWSTLGKKNIWGSVPEVVQMQSEGGAAGAVHGSLQAGSLTTTFTASQGLLLMIPNMYKIAGELTPTVFHIAARSLAAHALSIFGDHSDVMAARSAGWGMLFSNSVQEVMDFALIAHAATLKSRLPFLHVFDGFRTSHEIQKIEQLSADHIRAMINGHSVRTHRRRALSPDKPFIRGTAQNPDVFFQAREAISPYYEQAPNIVQEAMDQLASRTGRRYRLFDYVGAPDAERVIVLMGSGCEAAEETVLHLTEAGEKVGLIKVRLYRPFASGRFREALPATARIVAVLDRTKEPGAAGEPLYQDVVTAISEGITGTARLVGAFPRVIGGRYGLSSKEFTPAMVKGVFDEMVKEQPKNHFTVGIQDDVSHSSLDYDANFDIEPDDVSRAVFWGLGSDGTVGANKNSIKIIGHESDRYVQGYFVYDSKKAGARTISHLRFGPKPIRSTYLIGKAGFVAVHQFSFLDRYDTLEVAAEGATLLLNAAYGPEEVWNNVPRRVQQQILDKKLECYVIDADGLAKELGLGGRINTIMQTCFFALSDALPLEEATEKIKAAIQSTYGKRGEAVVLKNFAAVDMALERLYPMDIPSKLGSRKQPEPRTPGTAPPFVRDVTFTMMAGRGDSLPVSAMPEDGTYPSGTSRWEKRNLTMDVPVWEPDICIQCGKCVIVCPHAAIRAKVAQVAALEGAPKDFLSADATWREMKGQKYVLQVAVEDCTGCQLCVEVCPVVDKNTPDRKALNMTPRPIEQEQAPSQWDFFLSLPEVSRDNGCALKFTKSKDVQLLQPLFEFSGACAGCGETPYLSLLTRLFGDRALVANATGCSSIYGGNLPTTPWSVNKDGRGPAWSNSLFEDNAEFGLGMRLALDKQEGYARELVERLRDEAKLIKRPHHEFDAKLIDELLSADQSTPAGIREQRERVAALMAMLKNRSGEAARDLMALANLLVRKSVWIVGGDGWAYDIGYGGLDHVLASGRNVNLLVLDTEVYSNTGGQASKATALGAVAKFASGGKKTPKKDLGMLAMSYGYAYVAQVALGSDENQTIKAFEEAEAYDGPSLIIAYSQCIAHGIDMTKGMQQQDLAVRSGYWPLYRFDPRRASAGRNPLHLDSKPPAIPFKEYAYNEDRYTILEQTDPGAAAAFLQQAQEDVTEHWKKYERLARGNESNDEVALNAPPHRGNGDARPAPLPGAKVKSQGKLPPGY